MDLDAMMDLGAALRASDAPRGRYAPSPTGDLHRGNMVAALYAWLHARCTGATLVLRIEDLDRQRCKPKFDAQMLDDLRWLGLTFDEGVKQGGPCAPYRQSERVALFDAALKHLIARDLAYPCYCTRREIKAAATRSPSGELVYDGTCLDLTTAQRASLAATREPAWRFRVRQGHAVASFFDGVKGARAGVTQQDVAGEVGDFIIKRRDGVFAYQFAVVLDDITMGITDVVRGEDLYLSSPRQILLYEAFGQPVPRFWHTPLVMDEQGERKLSKRDRAHGVRGLGEQHGWSAADLWTHIARRDLGWSIDVTSIDDLLDYARCPSGLCERIQEAMMVLAR